MSIIDTTVKTLGECTVPSPFLEYQPAAAARERVFICDRSRVLCDNTICASEEKCGVAACPENSEFSSSVTFEQGGPREKIYFRPEEVRAAIVTCGGLCPGLNNVIYAVTLALWHNYGVRNITGFRYGYAGMVENSGYPPIHLTPDVVDGWQQVGGTSLGSSRGNQDPVDVVNYLQKLGVNVLFAVGGDGTMKGALAIAKEVELRGLKMAVIGIPKTIDNDILYLDETFGFRSAVERGAEAIFCAHAEAKGSPNGIGLVKLMGRDSGFIACQAALATGQANYVLIPEVPFDLGRFIASLRRRLERKQHAVIVVAEGAGQDLLQNAGDNRDASGNVLFADVGAFLKKHITTCFKEQNFRHSVKYIDPSYMVRSVPANAQDAVYCLHLGQDAVHAAMAGKTEMLLGNINGRMCHVPIPLVTSGRKKVERYSTLWRLVMQNTGQGDVLKQ